MKTIVIGIFLTLILFTTACTENTCSSCAYSPGQLVGFTLPDKSQGTAYADANGCISIEIGAGEDCTNLHSTKA